MNKRKLQIKNTNNKKVKLDSDNINNGNRMIDGITLTCMVDKLYTDFKTNIKKKDPDSSDSDDETFKPPKKKQQKKKSSKNTPIIIFVPPKPDTNKNQDGKNSKDGETKKKPIDCNNPLCNHLGREEDPTEIMMPQLTKIENIDDLIELGKSYNCKKNREFNGVNLRLLCNLVTPLTELKNMIGMKSVKTSIINQILFFLQGFNKNSKCNKCIDCTYNLPCAKNREDMLHTVITGPPGVGKTELGKILAKVYKEMGVLSKGHFVFASRADLIAGYLGQTALKTQDKIDEALGGVLFIDEAYALGHSEGRDSFSKECIDTLNQNLTENRDFLCIIAGYKNALDDNFFNMNAGLNRRFTFRYDIEKYTSNELRDIFLLKVNKDCWFVDFLLVDETDTCESINNKRQHIKEFTELFSKNINYFLLFDCSQNNTRLLWEILHFKKKYMN